MNCSSSPVPSVATTSACVSPRVNSAEPCVRGSTPTSATIGRTVFRSRPSMRMPVSRMLPADDLGLQILEHGRQTFSLVEAGVRSAEQSAAMTFALAASTAA